MTRSTPARLYQLRSKMTTSPAAGRWGTYRWMYICDCSRGVGAGSATTRKTRGLTRSVMRLIVPPLPAVSRPSKTMTILAPLALTHSCIATSSPCRTRMCFSYSFVFSLPREPPGEPPSAGPLRRDVDFLPMADLLDVDGAAGAKPMVVLPPALRDAGSSNSRGTVSTSMPDRRPRLLIRGGLSPHEGSKVQALRRTGGPRDRGSTGPAPRR